MLILLGGVFLMGMILLTCANIFARQAFIPIRGTFELMGYSGAVVTAFALGYTQFTNGHISVDVLFNTYSDKVKRIISILNHGICFIFFSCASLQVMNKALILKNTGEVSETLRIVYYPFTFAVAFGCFILSLTLFTNLLKAIIPEKKK